MNDLLQALHLRHVEKGLPDLMEQARMHSLTYDAFLRRFLTMEVEGRKLAPRVFVIDEIGCTRLTAELSNSLVELVRDRYEKGAIILTSNPSFAEWGSLLNDEILASALLDRLLHHVEVITVSGKSFRMKDRVATEKAKQDQRQNRNESRMGQV